MTVPRVWDPRRASLVAPGRSQVTVPFARRPIRVGAAPLGSTAYVIPAGSAVRYVSPSGSDSAAGTVTAPMRTIAAAVAAVKGSSTSTTPAIVVLRGGVYHEGAINPGLGYWVRIQSYPGEVVWLDGSTSVTSWTRSGSVWTAPYAAPPVPSLGSDILGTDPNANLPDLAFFDGAELLQVADGATPVAGQFSVDRTAGRITIAQDPTGRDVRVSDIAYVTSSGSRLDWLGVGIRRYRCVGNTLHACLYYGGASADTLIENCHMTQLGRNAVSFSKPRSTIRQCTLTRIGQQAVGATTAEGVTVERCCIRDVVTGRWNTQPVSGAIKITSSRDPVVVDNYISGVDQGNGLWFDVSVWGGGVTVARNFFDGAAVDGTTAGDAGICWEICDGGFYDGQWHEAVVAGNTVVNFRAGLVAGTAGNILWANNHVASKWTFGGYGARGILLVQSSDTNHGKQVDPAIAWWWTQGVRIINNRIAPQDNGWQLLAYDSQDGVPRPRAIARGLGSPDKGQQRGGDMFTKIAGNAFSPATGSITAGSVLATIGDYGGNRTNVNSIAALKALEGNTVYNIKPGAIGANVQITGDMTPDVHATAEPAERKVADLIGLPVGARFVGNPVPNPVPA